MGSNRSSDPADGGCEPAVRYERVSKRFGATLAVKAVDLDLWPGEVHAFVGANGAGKSTCLGMATGRIAPSAGTIRVGGRPLSGGDPREAHALGVHAIYQELTIVPALSAEANLFLGQSIARGGFLRERQMRQRYVELCRDLGVPEFPGQPAGTLSVANQQMLEIMRAVVADARVLLFDEPSASLAHAERLALFGLIDRLRSEGVAIALVSHNLDEVLGSSDVVSVFREGTLIETRRAAQWTAPQLVATMHDGTPVAAASAGHAPARSDRRVVVRPSADREHEPVLAVTGLASPGKLNDVDFHVRAGEIVGIAGLVGSGRTELLRALAGLDPRAVGTVTVAGRRSAAFRSVHAARAAGISLLPEDRKTQGLALRMSAADNVVLGEWRRLARHGYVREHAVRAAAARAAGPVGFDVSRLDGPAVALSGGNQQKLMLARWRLAPHPIMLADEPTRGVDIRAKEQITEVLRAMVADGRALVVVSSELEELVELSDRVVVLHGGRQVGQLDGTETAITPESVLETIFAVGGR